MELHELHVLVGEAGARHHGRAVAGARVRRRARKVGASVAARGDDRVVGAEAMDGAVLETERNDAHALALVHDEVESEVLDEEVRVVAQRLAVERVQERVARTIGDARATLGLLAHAVVERGAAERALIDAAVLFAAERHADVLELENGFWRLCLCCC